MKQSCHSEGIVRYLLCLLVGLLFVAGLPLSSHATVVRVPSEQPNIQAGIDAATTGDTVLVASGLYAGPGIGEVRISGKAIMLKSEFGADSTILWTLNSGRTILIDSLTSGSVIVDGFTITGGYETEFAWDSTFRGGIEVQAAIAKIKNSVISGCYSSRGGGIYVRHSAKTTIDNCTISGNYAYASGSAIYSEGDTLDISLSVLDISLSSIEDNWSNGTIGTIDIRLGVASLYGCRIERNRAPISTGGSSSHGTGGALFCMHGSVDIDSCVIAHNSATLGGAVICLGGSLTMTRNTVFNNLAQIGAAVAVLPRGSETQAVLIDHNSFVCNYSSDEKADGVWIWATPASSPPLGELRTESGAYDPTAGVFTIANNLFAFSTHAAIGCDATDIDLTIHHNNVWYPISGKRYSGLLPDHTGLNGNISADPLLCDVTTENLTFDISSPCNGTGHGGSHIGAFGIGCDMYDGGGPEKIIVLGMETGDSAGHSRDSVISAMSQAEPWDTIYLESPYYRSLEQIEIDIPLYLLGRGMENTHLDGTYGSKPLVNADAFCVIRDLYAERVDVMSGWDGVIRYANYPSILFACDVRGYPMLNSSAVCGLDIDNCSPLVRSCHLSGGTIMFWEGAVGFSGSFDAMMAHCYWWDDDDYYISMFNDWEISMLRRVFYDPMLNGYPTDVSDENEESFPSSYHLSQNYPNPFNPSTKINFSLPKATTVKLDIYNILGQKVTTLIDNQLPPGEHTVTWNAANRVSGIYFYRLQTDDFVDSKKMVLVR